MTIETPPMPRGGERLGAHFDVQAATRAVEFFPRYLRHTEAEWAGKPFRLAPWQRDLVAAAFGWKRADGTRLVRRIYAEVAKKNGKTEFAAGLALLLLLGDGEIGTYGVSFAANEDQAKIVFERAGAMVGMSARLSREIDVLKTALYVPKLRGSFQPVTSSPKGKHGFSVKFLIGDEAHEWKSDAVYEAMRRNMAAWRQRMEIVITNAGIMGQGPAWEMHCHALQVIRGDVEDPELLAAIFGIEPEDDWTDEAVWRKANPNLGVSPKLDFLRAECAKAVQSPRLENEFRRFHLSQWTEQAVRWLPMQHWRACTADPADGELWQTLAERMRGRPCFGGIDLAAVRDLTALCWVFPPAADDAHWTLLWRFWAPEEGVRERMERDRVDYLRWRDIGALELTPGNVTDYRFIEAQIGRDAEAFAVQGIGIDRWNATQVAVQLAEEGLPVQLMGTGTLTMSAPSKELERLVMAHEVEHGNHPVASWMAANAVVVQNAQGDIKPAKDRSSGKIDGVVGAIMGLALATSEQEQSGESVYEVLARARAAAAQADAGPVQADADEIDYAALNDIQHPDHKRMAAIFERRQAARADDDAW